MRSSGNGPRFKVKDFPGTVLDPSLRVSERKDPTPSAAPSLDGGDRVAAALSDHGVANLFTLCGGHISPILVGAKRLGIRVVDVRDEATAVFAADAVSRLTGVPGVAAVTAGPGATNTVTAVRNALAAQSPLVLLGGAAATVLRGRGALQDVDQLALFRPHVKWATRAARVRDLAPAIARAFAIAKDGVPGPVFVECPIDLLYPEALVRSWYGGAARGIAGAYLAWHVGRMFSGAPGDASPRGADPRLPSPREVERVAAWLAKATRPVLVVGSGALAEPEHVEELARAVERLGIPVWLAGMARGLLGPSHPLQRRHARKAALREADLVLLAGVPCDFRLDYGRAIGRGAFLVSVNRSRVDRLRNRRPRIAVDADPGRFLRALAESGPAPARPEWALRLADRDAEREREIATMPVAMPVDPVRLCREIDRAMDPDAIAIGDGGDFVATASYVVRPRGPLGWLDPGVFGTLGIGAGFALGAKLVRPGREVWTLFGDGAFGWSLIEMETLARHGIGVIAVIGNDGGWAQIARDQVEHLHDDVATRLPRADYHLAAEALGARGIVVPSPERIRPALEEAKRIAAGGRPVVVNVHLGRSAFRNGSLSI